MKQFLITIITTLFIVPSLCLGQSNANMTLLNYIKTDMVVYLESYDNKGNLKVNESFVVGKCAIENDLTQPTSKLVVSKAYKGGTIRIKYHPVESNTRFSIEPIQVPNNNLDVNHTIALKGLSLYDVNDNKKRLISLGTDLKFDSTTSFSRLIDVKEQLGSLVLGKVENNNLKIIEIIPLKKVDITYDKTSRLQETTVIEKSIVSNLKVSVPIYGSVESMMSNTELNQVRWDILYYPFMSNTSFSKLITELDITQKSMLLQQLKANDPTLKVYLLRGFDVIESGIFSVTTGTRINTEGSAALASVFTASAAYAFKSDDSKFISIPNQAYNLAYVEWQTVGSLIENIQQKIVSLPKDNTFQPSIFNMLLAK